MRQVRTDYMELYPYRTFLRIGGECEKTELLKTTLLGKYYLCHFSISGRHFDGVLYEGKGGHLCITDIAPYRDIDMCRDFLDTCDKAMEGNVDLMKERVQYTLLGLIAKIFVILSFFLVGYGIVCLFTPFEFYVGTAYIGIGCVALLVLALYFRSRNIYY